MAQFIHPSAPTQITFKTTPNVNTAKRLSLKTLNDQKFQTLKIKLIKNTV